LAGIQEKLKKLAITGARGKIYMPAGRDAAFRAILEKGVAAPPGSGGSVKSIFYA
jgi:hypothetical protein